MVVLVLDVDDGSSGGVVLWYCLDPGVPWRDVSSWRAGQELTQWKMWGPYLSQKFVLGSNLLF